MRLKNMDTLSLEEVFYTFLTMLKMLITKKQKLLLNLL